MKILHIFGDTKANRKFIKTFQEYNPQWKIKLWAKSRKSDPIRMAAWCIYEYGGLVIIDTRTIEIVNTFEHLPKDFIDNKQQVIVSKNESSPCAHFFMSFTTSIGIDYNIMYSCKPKQKVLKSVIKNGVFKQKDIPSKVLPIDISYWNYTLSPHSCIPKTTVFAHIYAFKKYTITIPSIVAMVTLVCIGLFLINLCMDSFSFGKNNINK